MCDGDAVLPVPGISRGGSTLSKFNKNPSHTKEQGNAESERDMGQQCENQMSVCAYDLETFPCLDRGLQS